MSRSGTGPAMEPGGAGTLLEPRYRRGDLLGAGGMGEVAACEDRWIGREVAWKTLRPTGVDPEQARLRFLREMRVQGQLEHPAIVPVHDVGVDAEGRLYFTMRRVHGLTLEQALARLARGDAEAAARFSRHRLLTAFESVCLAVHYAHTRGVLHRDLKPSNLMLGEFGEVYVLDWGIARWVADDAPADAALTESGALLGTPAYMSPEQLLHKASIDARADVYALGMILFEILALRPLHQGRDTAEIIEATVVGLDTRPSLHAPDVAPELDAVCTRATARDPGQRFANAQDLAAAIQRYLDGDRDLEQRRALAAEHAARAARAVERAGSREIEATEAEACRVEAMREVVKALALEPQQPDATRTLVQVLVTVPERMPAEVEAEAQQATVHQRLSRLKTTTWAFCAWLAIAPAALLAGVRSWASYGVTVGLTLASIGYAVWAHRRRAVATWNAYVLASLAAAVIGSTSTWLGPFMMVPMMAAVMALLFSTLSIPRERPVLVVLWVLAILVPFGLEVLGVLPPSYRFEHGALLLMPRAYALPPGPTVGALLYISVTWLLLPSLFFGRIQDALLSARRELLLHAWHFRRLLPEELATPKPILHAFPQETDRRLPAA